MVGARLASVREAVWGEPDSASAQSELAGVVQELLNGELDASQRGAKRDALCQYYRYFLDDDGRVMPLAVWAYVQRLWPLVECVAVKDRPCRVLDAGCGYVTESYLMALLGCEVTGVELVPARVEIARSRAAYFRSLYPGPLSVQFAAANVLSHLQAGGQYDIIWAMEAISHIHPAQTFVALAAAALVSGGNLVVSDPNRANPLALWRSIAIRGSVRHKTHRRFLDPQTGAPVEYGQEHITSVAGAVALLRNAGLEVTRVAMSGFAGTTILPRWLVRQPVVAALLQRTGAAAARNPLIRGLGTVYTVVARKA
jgi:2-polyprenyl-3-methyl-5-hydroxy-6-metoxy-1,4-benzoquinol methylase